MRLNILQIIFLGVVLAVTIYFTYATINLITSGGNVITIAGGGTYYLSLYRLRDDSILLFYGRQSGFYS